MDTVNTGLRKVSPIISGNLLVVVAVDRYVAIVEPYIYADQFTDRVVRTMIGVAYALGCLIGLS